MQLCDDFEYTTQNQFLKVINRIQIKYINMITLIDKRL